MDEQERTDALVRAWLSMPLPQRAPAAAAATGPMARPNGLYHASMLVRSVRENDREVDWVASTEAVDSYDTVIQQDWDGEHRGLDRFRANPVVLFAHDSRSLPIGRALKVEVENANTDKAALVTTVKFATAKANPMAEFCWQSVLEECLRGMSVGWMPGGYERREINGVLRTVFIRNELYEESVCPVPSNPEALARMAQRAFGQRIWSLPADVGGRGAPGADRASPSIPAVPAAAKSPVTSTEKKPMLRTLIIDNLAADQLRRLGAAEIKDGEDTFRLAMPNLTEIDSKMRATEERAVNAEKRVADLERDLTAANKRVTDAEAEKVKAQDEKSKAEKARDAAIAERATVELAPLTGLDPWQMTPAERDHVAGLAATNPESYKRMVAERTEKGVKAGAITRIEPRGHLPTGAPDPTPRGADGAPPGGSLFDQAKRAVDGEAREAAAAD